MYTVNVDISVSKNCDILEVINMKNKFKRKLRKCNKTSWIWPGKYRSKKTDKKVDKSHFTAGENCIA